MKNIADGTNGLTIIDVSNSSTPFLKGTYDTLGSGFAVHVVGNLAYVADGLSGLTIIDVSNPISPFLKGIYDTTGNARSVHVIQNLAYVADDTSGLQIIDVSYPSSPILKETYKEVNNRFNGVYVIGHLVYIADYARFLYVIENRLTLSGTPNQTQIGNYDIELIAKDPDQNQISQILHVRVEGPPVAIGSIPNQVINVGTPFTYFIDQTVFIDPNSDVIFYSSKLGNQNPLPSWLSFSTIGIFSGNPRPSDVGVYAIKVLAFDRTASQQAETTFSLVVDHFPIVTTTIPDHAADIGMLYNFSVPSGVFYDADVSDVLTYNATLSNGNALPSWLSFNGLVLSGIPSEANAGSLSVTLSARDQAFAKTQTSFTLYVEHFPDLVNPIPNQLAGALQLFTFVLPSNTYTDLDGDTISYTATRSDGSVLPFWLGFNSVAQEFQGTPLIADKGVLQLKVIARDSKGGQTAAMFDLNVVDSLGGEVAVIGREFVYQIPNNMIDNPQGPITYTLTLGSGSPLPSWLMFDPVNAVIRGTPPSTSEREYTLLIVASDGVQAPASGALKLQVDVNAAPQVANAISNQVAQVNQNYRFVVPDNTFIDLNGDPLILSALKANNQELPSWLKFDTITRTLQGKPGRGDTGAFSDKVLPLQICATDGNEKICSIFDLSVQGTSNQELAVSIGLPLGSALATGFAAYKKRGDFINPFNKSKYDKGTKVVSIGQPFTYKFEVTANKVNRVQAFKGKRTLAEIPLPQGLDQKGLCEWLKTDREICGGHLLPSWLKYDERNNQLTSSFNPRQEEIGLYVVRAYGHGDVILEEIKLDVGGQKSKDVEMLELLIDGNNT